MKIQILDKAKKKKFIEGSSELGLTKIRELLIRTGKERIRAYSGNLSKEEIMDIWKVLPIEGVGLYVGKDMVNRHGVREVRLSLDGLHTWKEQITKKVIVLNEEQEKVWFSGKNVELDAEQVKEFEGMVGFFAIRSFDDKDFIGTAKIGVDGKTLYGFLPKERRRKN